MTVSQLRSKYAGSKLGLWWAIVTPLILTLSLTLVFSVIFNVGIENFALFALAGIFPWLFFTNSLFEGANSFVTNSAVVHQAVFPVEYIPVSAVLSNLMNFVIGFVFILPLFLVFNFKVIILIPLIIFVILLHSFFILGLTLVLSVLNSFFKDVIHFLSIAFMVWFWITPVFYKLEMVPYPYKWISLLNPMTYYIISYRKLLFESCLPSVLVSSVCICLSLVFFVSGYLFIVKKEAKLLKRI